MAITTLTTQQFGGVQRDDIDITTTTQALITKAVQGTGISLSSTGVDAGTGDVTINVDINGLTLDSSPDYTADFFTTYDVSASTHKKVNLPVLASGTYTPTITGTSNVDSTTSYAWQYLRVGSVVTASGRVNINATTATSLTTFRISLPVASNFANDNELAGSGHERNSSTQSGVTVSADITNNEATCTYRATASTDISLFIMFTYLII